MQPISFRSRYCSFSLILLLGMLLASACSAQRPQEPITVGLIAPMSGGLAASGQAIQRGILLAIDEVNAAGGIKGRPLRLVVRDVQNDPAAGVAALRDLVANEDIVAVFGGIYSPVMLGQLDTIHELQVPLINPWGSISAITQNQYVPNYAFRVSVSDIYAGEFLVRYARETLGLSSPGILADTSAWGDSNVTGLQQWADALGLTISDVQRFKQGDVDMLAQVQALRDSGADSVLLIANAPEGAAIVRAMRALGWDVPVVSHWGISGGAFVQGTGVDQIDQIYTLQTYSFMGEQSERGHQVFDAYRQAFGVNTPREVQAPVGVAHGYDGMHLLALALRQAADTSGPSVRDALEHLPPYDGLLKRYDPAFTPQQHDALVTTDYMMTVWQNGQLVPAPEPRLALP